jgi:hypothetical protein
MCLETSDSLKIWFIIPNTLTKRSFNYVEETVGSGATYIYIYIYIYIWYDMKFKYTIMKSGTFVHLFFSLLIGTCNSCSGNKDPECFGKLHMVYFIHSLHF